MKRIISFFLALVLIVSCQPVMPAVAVESSDFYYRILGDNTLEITGYKGVGGAVVIPEYIDGLQVTGIGDNAFAVMGMNNITSISIPKTVISISIQPFAYQEKLEKIIVDPQNPNFFSDEYGVVYTRNNGSAYKELVVAPVLNGTYTVPDGVGFIRPHAFEYYNNLEKIILGKDVYCIGSHAFEGCRVLKEIVFTGSMVNGLSNWIQNNAFSGCSKLETIVLPDGLRQIDSGAFYGCKSLKAINIPGSVTSVGCGVFTDTDALKAITVDPANTVYKSDEKGVLYTADGLTLVSAPGGISGSYVIPDTVTTIGESAFHSCDQLKGIHLPKALTTMGNYAFQYCEGLQKLTIPGNLKEIPMHAFYYCKGLTAVRIPRNVEVIGSSAFEGCENLIHVALPSSLTEIRDCAFTNCDKLESLSLRSTAPAFSPNAFKWEELTIYHPKAWKADVLQNYGGTISWVAFKAAGDCGPYLDWTLKENGALTIHGSGIMTSCNWSRYIKDVKNVVFDGEISTICDNAFAGAVNLTEITFPKSMEKLGTAAFADTGLTSIEFLGNAPAIAGDSFQNVTATARYLPIYENWDPSTCLNYGGDLTWEAHTLTGPYGETSTWSLSAGGVLTISGTGGTENWEFGFDRFKKDVTKLVVAEGMTSILGFNDCVNLKEVVLPSTLTTIEWNAFANCVKLTEIQLPEGLETIGDMAFSGCTGLKTVVLPDSLKYLRFDSFSGCTALTDVYLSKNIESLMNPFYNCPNLKGLWAAEGSRWYNDEQGILYEPTDNGDEIYFIPPTVSGCLTVLDGVVDIAFFAFQNNAGITALSLPEGMSENTIYSIAEINNQLQNNGGQGLTTLTFRGNAPVELYEPGCLGDMTLTVRYPIYDRTWNNVPKESYGSKITWEAYDDSVSYGTSGKLYWVLKNDGHMIISGEGEMKPYVIPVMAYTGLIKKLTVKEGITGICSEAFANCTQLTTVSLPQSLTYIDSGAFRGCSAIKELTVPASVFIIGTEAFSGCSGLKKLQFDQATAPIIGEAALVGVTADCMYPAENDSWLPIVAEKFGGEPNWKPFYLLKDAKCGDHLTATMTHDGRLTIAGTGEMYDFEMITAPWHHYRPIIREVIVGEGVTYIGSISFDGCLQLQKVTLPESLESICYNSFTWCESLKTITIPAGVTEIWSWAFAGSGLQEIHFMGDAPQMQDALVELNATAYYYADKDGWTQDVLASAGEGITWVARMPTEGLCGENATWILKDGVLTISGTGAMTNWMYFDKVPWYGQWENIRKIVVEEGITTIGNSAFHGLTNVTEVTLPQSLTKIGSSSFYFCGMENIILPEGLKTIGNHAFEASNLTEVTVPDSVTQIGRAAFAHCEKMKTAHIGDGVYEMGSDMFRGCHSLEALTIPFVGGYIRTASDYYQYPFGYIFGTASEAGCAETKQFYFDIDLNDGVLSTYYIPESLKEVTVTGGNILYGAFSDCANLEKITLPEGITQIGGGAFYACSSLKEVIIPDTVERIAVEAFCCCESLTELDLPENLMFIGDFALGGCTKLLKLNFPNRGIHIGAGALSDTAWYNAQPDGVVYAGRTATGYKGTASTTVMLKPGTEALGSTGFASEQIILPVSLKSISFYGLTKTDYLYFTGSAPEFTSNYFSGTRMVCYYPAGDPTWAADAMPTYDGLVTWVPYTEAVQVGDTVYPSLGQAVAACKEGQYVKLLSDVNANVMLDRDLYVDVNGFELSGLMEANGYKIYGMDSTTDDYTCDKMGIFNCIDVHGSALVPQRHVRTAVTGSIRRYMSIKVTDGYTFHRFYIGVISQSVRPKATGVGFKAVLYGDDLVSGELKSFGFTMQLGGFTPKQLKKDGKDFISGKEVSLLISRYDVERYGETQLNASVMLELVDGTVIESEAASMTMRSMMEQIDRNTESYTAQQLQLLWEMLSQFEIVKSWNIHNLLQEEKQ